MYGKFYIDGKEYQAKSNPLECQPWGDTHPEDYTEPVSAYAEPNLSDAWQCSEGW